MNSVNVLDPTELNNEGWEVLGYRDLCLSQNDYDGTNFGARISSVFVLLVVSGIGSFFPLVSLRCKWLRMPAWCFFVTRYVGSGVIVATAFIHLLAEGTSALSNECLGGIFDEYPWGEGICLMGLFAMFFFDLLAHRHITKKTNSKIRALEEDDNENPIEAMPGSMMEIEKLDNIDTEEVGFSKKQDKSSKLQEIMQDDFLALQMFNSFILEFGIVFHSVFVGLSLAIAGAEFKSLYAAIAFHQFFEGLGLGTRFALTAWPENKKYIPWLLSLAYSLVTPVSIAIGLGVRETYPPGSRTGLITTGVFDSFCAGLLIYNSLAELIVFDFFHSPEFKGDESAKTFIAFVLLSIGAFAMALIGKWA